jgi:hypothetical protein
MINIAAKTIRNPMRRIDAYLRRNKPQQGRLAVSIAHSSGEHIPADKARGGECYG